MKFGIHLENAITKIFGYRAIADLTCDKIGSHFPIWPPSKGLSGKNVVHSCFQWISTLYGILIKNLMCVYLWSTVAQL